MSPTQGERLAALEAWQEGHESRCEERLAEIHRTAAGTDAKIDRLQTWIVGLVCTVAGFALVTLATLVLRGAGLG